LVATNVYTSAIIRLRNATTTDKNYKKESCVINEM